MIISLRNVKIILTLALIFFTLSVSLLALGFTYNSTPSLPLGFYKTNHSGNFSKNELITFKLKDYDIKFLKRIVASEGDLVEVNSQGVFINNIKAPHSKIFSYTKFGQKIQYIPFNRVLKKDEIFVMGEIDESYDSRYFGVLNLKELKAKNARAIWTWKDEQ